VREFWALGKNGSGGWRLVSIEQGAEGSHVLDEQIVATPWSDDQALRDEALIEGAVEDAVPEDVQIAELADLDYAGDARAAALDQGDGGGAAGPGARRGARPPGGGGRKPGPRPPGAGGGGGGGGRGRGAAGGGGGGGAPGSAGVKLSNGSSPGLNSGEVA